MTDPCHRSLSISHLVSAYLRKTKDPSPVNYDLAEMSQNKTPHELKIPRCHATTLFIMILIFILNFWTLLFYSLVRLLYLAWNWPLYQNQAASDLVLSFVYAIRFDLSAIAILSIPAVLIWVTTSLFRKEGRSLSTAVFVVIQTLFLLLNLFDVEYVQFTGRRFTVSVWTLVAQAQGQFLATLSAYGGLLVIALTTATVYAWFLWRRASLTLPPLTHKLRPRWAVELFLIVMLGVLARGGLQKKPIGFAHAQVFVNPTMNHLMLNSSFSLLQSIKRQGLPREQFMPQEEMLKQLSTDGNNPNPAKNSFPASLRPKAPQNVVILILESFSLEHMGKIHGDSGYTPFLDELAEKSLFFPNAFANARRSIEGMAAIIGGIPALMNEPFISSQFASNAFLGLGTLLGRQGYSTHFFHGGENGTMYFDDFARSAGFTRYYGTAEYPDHKDHDGSWGIWDEPFLYFMLDQLKIQKKPFLAGFFSLSSHNPFKVPPQYQGRFPKGSSEIHEVVGYTDESLRKFFDRAQNEPWYKDTLFVITADHTYKSVRPQYQNPIGEYRVPLLFFHPQIQKWPDLDRTEPVGHTDILPSILDFLGAEQNQTNLLGKSVFKKGDRFVPLYSEGFYWLVGRDYFLTLDAKNETRLYETLPHLVTSSSTDTSGGKEIQNPPVQEKYLKKLKAIRQYFSQGLWDNKLYYPHGR